MNRMSCLTALFLALSCEAAEATVWPQSVGDMKHAQVFFDGSSITVSSSEPGPLQLLNHAESYIPPADVLDGMGYNNQYGFLKGQAFAPPVGTELWVEVLAMTPGLLTFEGGMRGGMVAHHTYAPILAVIGDRWMWNGSMNHPWHAASALGDYSVVYEIYVGDAATGEHLSTYVSDATAFSFTYVPEPTVCQLLFLGAFAAWSARGPRSGRRVSQVPAEGARS